MSGDAATPDDGGRAETETDQVTAERSARPRAAFLAVLRYFLRLGTLGFGGPIAVVGCEAKSQDSSLARSTPRRG